MIKPVNRIQAKKTPSQSLVHRLSIPQITCQEYQQTGLGDVLEGMLQVSGRRVIHCDLGANYVYEAWHFSPADTTRVLQVSWVSFDGSSRQWLAILVNAELVTLHCASGSQVDLALPLAVESMWPLEGGILFECVLNSCQDTKYLTLHHPLGEIKALLEVKILSIHERVLFLQGHDLVSYDGNSHSFWHVSWHHRLVEDDIDRRGIHHLETLEQPSHQFSRIHSANSCVRSRDNCEQLQYNGNSCETSTQFLSDADGVVQLVHQTTPCGIATAIFNATDLLGRKLLCLVLSDTLVAFSNKSEVAFELPGCLDAAPVAATHDKNTIHIVVLRQDHTLHLLQGCIPIAQLVIPTEISSSCKESSRMLHTKYTRSAFCTDANLGCWRAISDITHPEQTTKTAVIYRLEHAVGESTDSLLTRV